MLNYAFNDFFLFLGVLQVPKMKCKVICKDYICSLVFFTVDQYDSRENDPE